MGHIIDVLKNFPSGKMFVLTKQNRIIILAVFYSCNFTLLYKCVYEVPYQALFNLLIKIVW